MKKIEMIEISFEVLRSVLFEKGCGTISEHIRQIARLVLEL